MLYIYCSSLCYIYFSFFVYILNICFLKVFVIFKPLMFVSICFSCLLLLYCAFSFCFQPAFICCCMCLFRFIFFIFVFLLMFAVCCCCCCCCCCWLLVVGCWLLVVGIPYCVCYVCCLCFVICLYFSSLCTLFYVTIFVEICFVFLLLI